MVDVVDPGWNAQGMDVDRIVVGLPGHGATPGNHGHKGDEQGREMPALPRGGSDLTHDFLRSGGAQPLPLPGRVGRAFRYDFGFAVVTDVVTALNWVAVALATNFRRHNRIYHGFA